MLTLNNVPTLSQTTNGGYVKTSQGFIRVDWEMSLKDIPTELWEEAIEYIFWEM